MLLSKSLYQQLGDTDLFELVKQNNISAYEEIYNRHWPPLVNAAYKRLSSRHKAEDIVQNIFIDLYQRRVSIDLTISLKAYLNHALKFKILNEYRAEMIRAKYQKTLFFSDVCKNDFAEKIDAKELQKKIDKALNELPEKCKQVFMLSRKENFSNRDISESLSISVSTVEKHISKALKSIRCKI